MINYVQLLSTLIGAVKAVEALMPTSPGKDKFAAAMAIVEGVTGEVTSNLPALEGVVKVVVDGLNALGIFKKKQPPTPPAA